MHEVVFVIAVLWLLALIGMLIGYAVRSRPLVERAVALDMLAVLFVAALALVARYHEEAGYLDVALVMAMLGFAQTVATVRLVERRRDLS